MNLDKPHLKILCLAAFKALSMAAALLTSYEEGAPVLLLSRPPRISLGLDLFQARKLTDSALQAYV
jgi:hypothetical protein